LQATLKKEGCQPLYLITGEEDWLVQTAAKMIEEVGLDGGLPEFNLSRYSSADGQVEAALSTAATLPMMGARRVVTLRLGGTIDEASSALLLEYLGQVVPTTVLILVAPKVDARQKVIKSVKKQGVFLSFGGMKARDAVSWLVGEAQSKAYGIDYDAATLLVDEVGTDLRTLSTNLEKLVAFVGEERSIRRGDVLEAVDRTREEVIWDLTDAVGAGNWQKALLTLRGLLVSGQSPILLVAMLARHTRQLWTVKSMLSQGETPDSVAKKAKIHPFVAKKLAGQAGRFEVSRLRDSMVQFFEADRALKSSRLDGGTIVETLVLDLCGVKSVDRRYST